MRARVAWGQHMLGLIHRDWIGVRREPVLNSYDPICFNEIGTEERHEPCLDGI